MWIQIDEAVWEKRKEDGGESAYIQSRIDHYKGIDGDKERKYRDAAEVRDGELEVDSDAVVSMSPDGGAYVMSWQWVADEEVDEKADEAIGGDLCDFCMMSGVQVLGTRNGKTYCAECAECAEEAEAEEEEDKDKDKEEGEGSDEQK